MPAKSLPPFPYEAVYFAWSNPPQEDWERDYKTASEDGVNIFRHRFMWSAIEQAPGKFVWDAYDRQLDLAPAVPHVTRSPESSHRRIQAPSPRRSAKRACENPGGSPPS